jgi:acylphosphatase
VFEGEPEAVERLLELCRSGPGHAHVERLDVADEAPEGLDGFAVR